MPYLIRFKRDAEVGEKLTVDEVTRDLMLQSLRLNGYSVETVEQVGGTASADPPPTATR